MRTLVSTRERSQLLPPLILLLIAVYGLLAVTPSRSSLCTCGVMLLAAILAAVPYFTHTQVSFDDDRLYLTPFKGAETQINFHDISLITWIKQTNHDSESIKPQPTEYSIYFRDDLGLKRMRYFDIRAEHQTQWHRALQLIRSQNPGVVLYDENNPGHLQHLKLS